MTFDPRRAFPPPCPKCGGAPRLLPTVMGDGRREWECFKCRHVYQEDRP